jgi:hypothetical protein
MSKKRAVRYNEGQWFAVPLVGGGYVLGIIVRGTYKTKGGLGYFFAPRYAEVPDGRETQGKAPSDAILKAWFGDLGIIEGRWPLVNSVSEFDRSDWPVPTFRRLDPINPSVGWLVEYDDDINGLLEAPVRESVHAAQELSDLPKDGVFGARALEVALTRLLSSTP